MTTRTTRQRETLQERCIQRGVKTAGIVGHVRAELERLAGQVRKLDDSDGGKHKHQIGQAVGRHGDERGAAITWEGVMDIGEAIKQMKSGQWIRRAGWNGKNMHLYIEDHLGFTVHAGVFKGERRHYEPCIVMFTAQGKHQPGWLASQPDLLATDWEVVPAAERK